MGYNQSGIFIVNETFIAGGYPENSRAKLAGFAAPIV
jgi:hypothetical protein